jgi:SAM-dependent methyltransferase
MNLSAVVIALDEEKRIVECLKSLGFCDEIILVDSGSVDRTRELAKEAGARVFERVFDDFASQKNFGVERAGGEWILSVDADERVSPELQAAILEATALNPKENAFKFKRDSFIFGRRFLRGGTQNDFPLRLFRKAKARFVQKIHEKLEVEGSVGAVKGVLIHHTFENASQHLRRLNHYTSLEAEGNLKILAPREMLARAFLRFVDIFILKQAFREKMEGFIFSVLSAWYEIVKQCKIWERQRRKMASAGPAAATAHSCSRNWSFGCARMGARLRVTPRGHFHTQPRGWGHFYSDSGDEGYYQRHVEIHAPFFGKILETVPQRLLETGCGSGIMSVYFSKKGIDCTAIDRDSEVLKQASQSAAKLGGKVDFRAGDIFHLDFPGNSFDAVFSQGVLEHFSDEQIRAAVAESLRVAPRVWISVPSEFYNHKDFGDERLLSAKNWAKILSGLGSVETIYYFHQRVKRNFLIRRPLMLMIGVCR